MWGVMTALVYGWARLHDCRTASELRWTVEDYRQNFPCVECREHFDELLSRHPYPLEYVRTCDDVCVWTWMTHNLVNVRLEKPWVSFVPCDFCV